MLPGDTNDDGKVDFTDLLTLAQHYGQSGATWQQGDFNASGTVDFADLLALAQHYGQSQAAGAVTDAVALVPEPVGISALLGAFALARRRRAHLTVC